jgi:hypothetical protein
MGVRRPKLIVALVALLALLRADVIGRVDVAVRAGRNDAALHCRREGIPPEGQATVTEQLARAVEG